MLLFHEAPNWTDRGQNVNVEGNERIFWSLSTTYCLEGLVSLKEQGDTQILLDSIDVPIICTIPPSP